MDHGKNLDSQEDSAPPAAFIQIKGIFDKNNNKPKIEETNYLYKNYNFTNIYSNEIIQNQINSFQTNENKTLQNLSCPTYHQGNNVNKMMSLDKLNAFNQEHNTNYNITKNQNENENILNPTYGDYFDDIMIISHKNKIFHCINHNKSFIDKSGLMSHCKETHRFRCGKCGLFFGIKKKLGKHFGICEKNELKENKNKCSEYEFITDDDESVPIHFGEMHDKKNQNEKNIFHKFKFEEDYNINIKNNKYEKNTLVEKYKNQDEEEKIKKEIELKTAEDIVKKILLKRQKEEMQKQTALKRKKELKEQKKLKKSSKRQEELKKQEDSKVQEDSKTQEDSERQEDTKANEESKTKKEKLQRKVETKVFTCYKDGKKFGTIKGYIKHFATLHPYEYPFYCHLCKHGTYSNNALENHYRSKNHLAKFIKLYK